MKMTPKAEIKTVEAVSQTNTDGVRDLESTKANLGKDVDDAFRFTLESEGAEISWTEEEERKVVRKIDMVILPLVIIDYNLASSGMAGRLTTTVQALYWRPRWLCRNPGVWVCGPLRTDTGSEAVQNRLR